MPVRKKPLPKAEVKGTGPEGHTGKDLTSMMQVGDLVCNADLKVAWMDWYTKWKVEALKGRALGHCQLKITREEIIEAGETIFREFNRRQVTNPTIRKCFTSCGQNIFDDDLKPYFDRMKKYDDVNLYRMLKESMQANMIENQRGIVMAMALDDE